MFDLTPDNRRNQELFRIGKKQLQLELERVVAFRALSLCYFWARVLTNVNFYLSLSCLSGFGHKFVFFRPVFIDPASLLKANWLCEPKINSGPVSSSLSSFQLNFQPFLLSRNRSSKWKTHSWNFNGPSVALIYSECWPLLGAKTIKWLLELCAYRPDFNTFR